LEGFRLLFAGAAIGERAFSLLSSLRGTGMTALLECCFSCSASFGLLLGVGLTFF
jgi:hypothetical protein